jgi:hypothetical protein
MRPGAQPQGAIPGLKPHEAKRRAVMGNREMDTALLNAKTKARRAEALKPAIRGTESDEGSGILSGVKADSASRKMHREIVGIVTQQERHGGTRRIHGRLAHHGGNRHVADAGFR